MNRPARAFFFVLCLWAAGWAPAGAYAKTAALKEITGFREAWPRPAKRVEVFRPEEGRCRFGAYIWNPDETATEVLDAPGGNVIAALPFAPDDPNLIMFEVMGFRGEWLLVEIYDGRKGWLCSGSAEATLRNYGPGDSAELRAGPGVEHPPIGDIYGEEPVKILGGEGKWALIRYIDENKGEVTGWTEAQNLCGHPYTTCP
ncbi:MAG: SH3 domain-containing protein [Synergistaceae bacterium]|nr:SH3 domain-containing protein [Synergistaceae bacterium]